MSAAEGASEASSPEQANEWAVRANDRTDERVAQYFSLYFWLFWTIGEDDNQDPLGTHQQPRWVSNLFVFDIKLVASDLLSDAVHEVVCEGETKLMSKNLVHNTSK